MVMKKTVKNQRLGDIRKQSPKKSVKRVTKKPYKVSESIQKIESKFANELYPHLKSERALSNFLSIIDEEVVILKKKVAELESTTLKVGQQVRYNEPKEPETFEDCVSKFPNAYSTSIQGEVLECGSYSKQTLKTGSSVPSEKRAKQLAAIAKMMTVADALKGEYTDKSWEITYNTNSENFEPMFSYYRKPLISFPNDGVVKKVIKILGEDVIRTAFEL